jgi:hypothetical protein
MDEPADEGMPFASEQKDPIFGEPRPGRPMFPKRDISLACRLACANE